MLAVRHTTATNRFLIYEFTKSFPFVSGNGTIRTILKIHNPQNIIIRETGSNENTNIMKGKRIILTLLPIIHIPKALPRTIVGNNSAVYIEFNCRTADMHALDTKIKTVKSWSLS